MTIRKERFWFDENDMAIKYEDMGNAEFISPYQKWVDRIDKWGFVGVFAPAILFIVLTAIFKFDMITIISLFVSWIAIAGFWGYAYLKLVDKVDEDETLFYKDFYGDFDDGLEKAKNDLREWEQAHPLTTAYQKAHPEISLKEAKIIVDNFKKM